MKNCNETIIVASYARSAQESAKSAAYSACLAQQAIGASGATGATGSIGATGIQGATGQTEPLYQASYYKSANQILNNGATDSTIPSGSILVVVSLSTA